MSKKNIETETLNKFLNDKKCVNILSPYIYGFMANINKSKKTPSNTMYITLKYIEFFDKYLYYYHPSTKIKDINKFHIEEYKLFCEYKLHNSYKTINSKLISLKKFFKYLTETFNLYEFNFMLNVAYLKNKKEKLPTIMTVSELKLLFNEMRNYPYGIRDICMSKIILQTGLKIQDVINLEINQLSLSDKVLVVTNNTGTVNYSLSSVLIKELSDYLQVRSILDINNSKYLFLSKRGTQYLIRSYQMFFDEAVKRCKFKVPYSPRNLRSTFLYRMSKIVDKNRLKEISAQNSVQKYYELNKNPLRDII